MSYDKFESEDFTVSSLLKYIIENSYDCKDTIVIPKRLILELEELIGE